MSSCLYKALLLIIKKLKFGKIFVTLNVLCYFVVTYPTKRRHNNDFDRFDGVAYMLF